MKKRGISLIVLVITIIVIIILAGIVIFAIGNSGILDKSKKARFMSDYTSVQEVVNVYSASKYNANTDEFELPIKGYLTSEDKTYIKDNVPTLNTKIEELSGPIDTAKLAWINSEDINATLSKEKQEKGYIIDVTTGQIYDYIGDFFEGKRWHTLDAGVAENITAPTEEVVELWNGWIKLTLYYPASSTEKQWRLGSVGELRADPILMWQNYNGPITVPLDRVKDVWIKYKINNKEVTIPPAGTLLVDIVPDKTGSTKVSQVNVKINYDEAATLKEYRINDSGWLPYTAPFVVTENCIIEARAKKAENVYNTDGSLLMTRDIVGSDMVYIGNIGAEDVSNPLIAPTIEKLPAVGSEKARVKITYPAGADKKIYTMNYGAEQEYTSEVNITSWGTTIVAYYYDAQGNKSRTSRLYIYDPNAQPGTATGKPLDDPNPDTTKTDDTRIPKLVPPPTITRLAAQDASEKARVSIAYPENAVKRVYKVNYGVEQEYTGEISIKAWGTNVIAYYYDASGKMSQIASITINDTTIGEAAKPSEPYNPLPPYKPGTPLPPTKMDTDDSLPAPTITRLAAQDVSEKARVNVVYPAAAVRKVYTVNNGTEIEYTSDIKIIGWDTVVTAYYYDVKGNKSRVASILINSPTDLQGKPQDPLPPTTPPIFKPESVVAAPTIGISPSTGIVNEVTVSVTTPVEASKIYLKLGKDSEYKEYTTPVTVRENMDVYVYYIAATGETSLTASTRITNIKSGDKPYLKIDASPYPWPGLKGASEVGITITTTDATKVEYSEDGIIYKDYTATFKVNENKRIFARATNANGTTESYLDITNIGETKPSDPMKKLDVSISVDPEPLLSTAKVAKAKVTIDYDSDATEKYYTIGKSGTLQTYTAPFDITSNCTVYAYAKSTNGQGTDSKLIDNISNGISEPVIVAVPNNSIQASKVLINISYDKSATVKQYSINGATLRNYNGQIEVTENGTTIYAYSQNALGQKSSAKYTVQNIVPLPPILILDKGGYYLLKLNYPPDSSGREYKWKLNGAWSSYKDDGILLIKPQYKDTVIKDGTLIKIEDENGKLIDFKGDYYLIDVPISELFENLFMRWDRVPPTAPQIIINSEDAAKQVSVSISYSDTLIKKQYKVISPDGTDSGWKEYTGPINIDRNNSIIYAKGMDDTEVWSSESMKKITNIDEISPEIKLTADLESAQQKVGILVSATDNMGIGKVKYAKGVLGESYFINAGIEISNNSVVNITENGYYTFYAEDKVGNPQVYTLNVTNVDLTAPSISISVNPENTIGITTNVTINYGDSTLKQYKVGTNNTTWLNYTNTFALTSNTVLTNNWQNTDGTVTVYAKGKDSAGNEVTVQKKILNLDLNRPAKPILTTTGSGYPLITEWGVLMQNDVSIVYDTMPDINNLYSVDNGSTWQTYVGTLKNPSATVLAKSVKKSTGLESVVGSITIVVPADAITYSAYDDNASTYMQKTAGTRYYMEVDSSMWGKNIRMKWGITVNDTTSVVFLGSSYQTLNTITINGPTSVDTIYTIPVNTKWIAVYGHYNTYSIYEIQRSNEPTFTAANGYIKMTADVTKEISNPYQMVTINYFQTSVQRLYRIGTTGEWLNYNDQPILVWQGETIYAKGIDQYGNETRVTSSYTANSTDAILKEVYDNNVSTYMQKTAGTRYYMEVDSSMWGKNIRMKWGITVNDTTSVAFLGSSYQTLNTITINGPISVDTIYTIPVNTKWIAVYGHYNTYSIYEIQRANEPTYAATNGYMKMSYDVNNEISNPYQMVTINYFPTSIQRLYRIGTTGDWISYTDQPIWLWQGATLYAKGIDKYGNETRVTSSYTANSTDAILKEVYDNNFSTYMQKTLGTRYYMEVDSSMWGKNIRMKWGITVNDTTNVAFLGSSYQTLNTKTINGPTTVDTIYTIPVNTKWITVYGHNNTYSIYEIQKSN